MRADIEAQPSLINIGAPWLQDAAYCYKGARKLPSTYSSATILYRRACSTVGSRDKLKGHVGVGSGVSYYKLYIISTLHKCSPGGESSADGKKSFRSFGP